MYRRLSLYTLLITLLMALGAHQSYAQLRNRRAQVNDTLSILQRFSFRTNTVDWLLLCPNIGVEFDVLAGDWNKWTVGADFLCNWNTKETFISSYVYDVMQATVEGRKYYRTRRGTERMDTTRHGLVRWVKYLSRLERPKARIWRAYYFGFYGSWTDYSFKFSSVGRQGIAYSVGGSFGFGMPLYMLGKGTLDLDIGGRLGLILTKYDAYGVMHESNCYPPIPEKSKNWHIVPFPMITDLHVSLVYRFHSIRNKYRNKNFEQARIDEERSIEMMHRRDSIRLAKDQRLEQMAEELKIQEEARKARKARKAAADSLGIPFDPEDYSPAELKARQIEQRRIDEKAERKKAKKAEKAEKPEKQKSQKALEKAEKKAAKKKAEEERKAAIRAAKQAAVEQEKVASDDRKEEEQ